MRRRQTTVISSSDDSGGVDRDSCFDVEKDHQAERHNLPRYFRVPENDFGQLHLSSTTWLQIETSIIRKRVMPSHSACNLIGSLCLHALHQELRSERHNFPIGDKRHNLSLETGLKDSVYCLISRCITDVSSEKECKYYFRGL